MYSVGLLFCFVFFWLWYVAFWDSKTPHRLNCERVSYYVKTSSPSGLPPQDRSPSLTLFSLFVLYILSYLLSKRTGYLSGCLVFSASVQKLFCGSFSAFKWSFDEFVGVKVVSPSYSSAILVNQEMRLLAGTLNLQTQFDLGVPEGFHRLCAGREQSVITGIKHQWTRVLLWLSWERIIILGIQWPWVERTLIIPVGNRVVHSYVYSLYC